MDPIDTYRSTRTRQECCCGSRAYAVRDFPFIYKHVEVIKLPDRHKNLMLSRYVHIMEKIKQQFGCFSGWYTCSKTCLIVGNIAVPSIMSVQALLQQDTTARTVLFWLVWFISIFIAIVSSFVTFCNTQKKYNLFNQFNTKVQRELWAYLTLTGRYRILRRHRRMAAKAASLAEAPLLGAGADPGDDLPTLERTKTFLFDDDSPDQSPPPLETKQPDAQRGTPRQDGGGAGTGAAASASSTSIPASVPDDPERLDSLLDHLYAQEQIDDEFLNFTEQEPEEDIGHIIMFNLFMNRLELLYRFLTNSNIDIELEDTNLTEDGESADYHPTATRPTSSKTVRKTINMTPP